MGDARQPQLVYQRGMIRRLAPCLLVLPLLGGCVGRGIDAPSLQQRPFEREEVPVPDEASEPASTLDPALKAKLQTLIDSATHAHADFTEMARKTGEAVAKAAGTPAGGESWTAAQQELSALDARRGPLQAIEADVDALRTDPAAATPANRNAIDAGAAQVQALADQENATVRELSEKLKV